MSDIPWAGILDRVSQSLGPELSQQLATLPLPPLHRVMQRFPRERVVDVDAHVRQVLSEPAFRSRVPAGARVAITAGSRGVARIPEILRAVARTVASWEAKPFIIPAMGSHGGATAEGQREILADYGVTEESVGAPIVASMETVRLGEVLDGVPVYASADAARADAVIVVNRIKPHTGFRGEVESGLLKMLAIGLGKQHGAETLHAEGMDRFAELIPAAGELMLARLPVVLGIGIVENGYEEPAKIVPILPENLRATEAALLKEARALMPSLPFDRADVLVVGAMGKNISGSGMDPNVIGRFFRGLPGGVAPKPEITRIAVLDLTPESHGNAVGIGTAEVTTARLFRQLDLPSIYANSLTAAHLAGARIPVVMESDRAAIAAAIKSCPRVRPETVRLALIRNTLELGELWVSPALVAEVRSRSYASVDDESGQPAFNAAGDLVGPIGRRVK